MTHTQQEKRNLLAHYQTQESALIQDTLDNLDLTALQVLQLIAQQRRLNLNITAIETTGQGRAVH